jgi:hypothetical protein
MKPLAFTLRLATACALWLALSPASCHAAETNAPVPGGRIEETNSQEILRAYLQLQEQLHATQLAVEQTRKEARDAAALNAEALAARLKTIEQTLAAQRAQELDAMQAANRSMQASNRVMLIVAATFATVGFIAMLVQAFFQWRAVNGLAEIAASLPAGRLLGLGGSLPALGPGETHLVSAGAAEQSNLRLLGAMEQLEKRLHDLEHSSRASLKEASIPRTDSATANGHTSPEAADNDGGSAAAAGLANSSGDSRIDVLLAEGQSMLSLEKPEAAITCFDQVLTLDPLHAEALVKKGTALEKLQKLNEAIECYDHAIEANGAMTIAYLHKGGLFNRMERFAEAIECYEQALRTQERRHH